jgi:hypothetical protein
MSDLMEADAPATRENSPTPAPADAPATRENSPIPAPATMRKDPSVPASTSATARFNIKLDVATYLNINKRQLHCLPEVLFLVGFDTLVSVINLLLFSLLFLSPPLSLLLLSLSSLSAS